MNEAILTLNNSHVIFARTDLKGLCEEDNEKTGSKLRLTTLTERHGRACYCFIMPILDGE